MAELKVTTKRIAYIFEDIGGWYVCDDDDEMLDTRGKAYYSKNAAIAAVRWVAQEWAKRDPSGGYTHYRTGSTKPRKLI